MSASATLAYRVVAFNTAAQSENKIHDDSVAARFGFTGGLVPGVDVYAYMTHLPVARWGRDWLEHGTASCRFANPVYDGRMAEVTGVPSAQGLELLVSSDGATCATGEAGLDRATAPPDVERWDKTPPDVRPPASAETLAPCVRLTAHPVHATAELAAKYLADLRETAEIYARENLVHPGLVLRLCNWALTHNVVLGPWIHVGSTVRNLSAARVGETLRVQAVVTGNYEHKQHLFVELDALVLADDRPVARIAHVAIYRPRQVLGEGQGA
jgi:hypothetical protein